MTAFARELAAKGSADLFRACLIGMIETHSFSSEEALNDSVYACSSCKGDKGRGVNLSRLMQAGYPLKSLFYVL
jgi:hypothetical protein